MSSEQSILKSHTSSLKSQVIQNETNQNSRRVNINDLLSRVRDKEKKQRKENLVFFGLVSSVVIATGIIASF